MLFLLLISRYTSWGDRIPHRPTEDIAFAVARFFQRGGSFQNYYMVCEIYIYICISVLWKLHVDLLLNAGQWPVGMVFGIIE